MNSQALNLEENPVFEMGGSFQSVCLERPMSDIRISLYIKKVDYYTMVFYVIKHPWHQPNPYDCVPTTLKVLFENQFGIKLGFRKWKNETRCNQFGVATLDAIRGLESWLIKEYDIQVIEKTGLTARDIENLLNESVLPFVYVRMNYLEENKEEPIVDEEGTNFSHSIIPVGIEDDSVYIYDCFKKGYPQKELPKAQVKVKMSVTNFLKEWDKRSSRAFWFKQPPKKDRELKEFVK